MNRISQTTIKDSIGECEIHKLAHYLVTLAHQKFFPFDLLRLIISLHDYNSSKRTGNTLHVCIQ